MKIRKIKLFIPIKTSSKTNTRITLRSANKIKELEPFLPSEEALKTHIEIQHIKMAKDRDYRPEPLNIRIERGIFDEIIQRYGLPKEAIPLTLQWPAVPICLILPN